MISVFDFIRPVGARRLFLFRFLDAAGIQQRFRRYWTPVSLICGTQFSYFGFLDAAGIQQKVRRYWNPVSS